MLGIKLVQASLVRSNWVMLLLLVLAQQVAAAEAQVFSGSGYAAAENSVVNYTYNNFGGFYVTVANHKLRWQGFHGYFYGLVSANPPQISEVAPNVFLKSWTTRGTGSDNVVMNFNNHRVTAHLQPDRSGRGNTNDSWCHSLSKYAGLSGAQRSAHAPCRVCPTACNQRPRVWVCTPV